MEEEDLEARREIELESLKAIYAEHLKDVRYVQKVAFSEANFQIMTVAMVEGSNVYSDGCK